jgi:hypothetical protein
VRFVAYEAATEANVVVDGSPNPSTVLTLSHWPAMASPSQVRADTSAEMVLRYLDGGADLHGDAQIVTNNHFDQDGLAGLLALVNPDAALERRNLLVDLARSGDFATYTDRRAARASMAVSAMAAAAAPAPYPEQCAALYEEALSMVVDLLDHPEGFRHLWKDEDEELTEAERAVAAGLVEVREVPDIDLALVTLDRSLTLHGGHRFGGAHADGLHPMALHRATSSVRLLVAHGERYSYTDRYETWVQYRSRQLPRRVDLAPLAEELTAAERDGAAWIATSPGGLTPTLGLADGAPSSLPFAEVATTVERHLRTAPPAWDPYSAD